MTAAPKFYAIFVPSSHDPGTPLLCQFAVNLLFNFFSKCVASNENVTYLQVGAEPPIKILIVHLHILQPVYLTDPV